MATTNRPAILINATPHDVTVVPSPDETITFPRSGSVVRLKELPRSSSRLGLLTTPLCDTAIAVVPPPVYGGVTGLPDGKTSGLIVSSLAGEAMARQGGCIDIYSPDMSSEGAVRDKDGRITGTTALIKWC